MVLSSAAQQKTALTVVLMYAIFILAATWYLRCISWNSYRVWKVKPEIGIDCQHVFDGSMRRVKDKELFDNISDDDFMQKTVNCTWVLDYFNNNSYTTNLEESFPIAFTFLIHNSAHQVIRLLKLLYRPHNQYCIAIDKKSNVSFINIFRKIANCLGNVHVASKLLVVEWGHKSIIQSQMQCYSDLLKVREKQAEEQRWKYVINLCGKEVPLNSNHEIVSHMVRLNGTSAVGARKIPSTEGGTYSRLKKQSIPHSLPLYKSMTYMSLSYKFVNFLLTNSTAIQLYNFFLTCEIPEEHYYATVYMIPNVPGGFNPDMPRSYYFLTDSYFWRTKKFIEKNGRQCSGMIVHNICIVDSGDLKRIVNATNYGKMALFHNKYFMEYDHVVMDRMEERILSKNKLECLED